MFQVPKNLNKGIVNDVSSISIDAMTGLAMCHQGLVMLEGHRVIMRRDHCSLKGKVKLLSGGGSGHEPGQTGCIGPGMLTAAVMGDVFRAPSPTAILTAIRELTIDHSEGVLLIILNYVNNRLNFGLAMDRACKENLKVRMILVGDDCAVKSPPESMGRRGLAGFVLYCKVAGAMAEEGRKLEDIYNALRRPNFAEMATLGVAYRSPNVPGSACSYHIVPEEFEIGVSIHSSEPGVYKISSNTTANTVVSEMLERMLEAGVTALLTPCSEGVVVFINNLGGSCKIEMQVFAMEVLQQLAARNVHVRRVIVGTAFTVLDMCGLSITLMQLDGPFDIVKYLDADAKGTGWPKGITASCANVDTDDEYSLPVTYEGRVFDEPPMAQGPCLTHRGADSLHQILRVATEAIMAATDKLNMRCWSNQDWGAAGSSDSRDAICGNNVKKGAEEILHALHSGEIDTTRPYATLRQMCNICEKRMSGLSGPLYSLFFMATCLPFAKMAEDAVVDARVWIDALSEGIAALKRYGRAKSGDRTMLDSLLAAETVGHKLLDSGVTNGRELANAMAIAAEEASAATVSMPVIVNRSRYEFRQVGDAGAFCVAVWMRGVSDGILMVS